MLQIFLIWLNGGIFIHVLIIRQPMFSKKELLPSKEELLLWLFHRDMLHSSLLLQQ